MVLIVVVMALLSVYFHWLGGSREYLHLRCVDHALTCP